MIRAYLHCLAIGATFVVSACEDDPLAGLSGRLVVEMLNLRDAASTVAVKVEPGSETSAPAVRPSTTVRFDPVKVGLVRVEVTALDAGGGPLDRATAYPVAIIEERESRVVLDFSSGTTEIDPPVTGTPGVCLGEDTNGDGARDPIDVLCASCDPANGTLSAVADDPECGSIACQTLDVYRIEGDNTATGSPKCYADNHPALEHDRCAEAGVCKAPDAASCPSTPSLVLEAGVCELIEGCAGPTIRNSVPSKVRAPNGVPCGSDRTCQDGVCVPTQPPPPAAGCADGSREGFLDQSRYPSIAGCSGAWSVGGVLTATAPACGRGGGDDGANSEGSGCSAADLCSAGWHICGGRVEVAARATSCTDAVPPGTPNKALFFAAAQTSDNNSVCGGTGHNDVFGCGNLGTTLTPDKACGPLDRALASTAPNSCGFNEAEPNLGPWQCLGGADSHLREGELVTKVGCPGRSCTYDGQPIGSSDKGGVLCCRD